MSGGVDSSVVAHLLKEQGHELVGVMMKLWTDPLAPEVTRAIPTKCCSVEHIQRARSVCSTLGIPFYVLNLEDEFKDKIVDPFLRSHEIGENPNPCIECNREIKFGMLLKKAGELECDMLATGHYARTAVETHSDGSERHVLLEALDIHKDQSYYLYTLTQEKLRKVLFPLGHMEKREVLERAKTYGIPINSQYRESQDLCFFPEKTSAPFLRRHLKRVSKGDIRTTDGALLGTHDGLPFYTVGQRKGLKIGGMRIPLHVDRKDPSSNTIFVAQNGADLKTEAYASNMHWISWSPDSRRKSEFFARIHSLGEKHRGFFFHENGKNIFRFQHGVRGIAPGQHIVLYRGSEVVGGGRIIFPTNG